MDHDIQISREVVQLMLDQLHRAEGYCSKAVPASLVTWEDEPTASYPGASGCAGGTMRSVICTLESYL